MFVLLGYGHIAPTTPLGQVACIFYAIFGIPLFFLYLAKLGALMAAPVKRIYWTISCAIARWRDLLCGSQQLRHREQCVNSRNLEDSDENVSTYTYDEESEYSISRREELYGEPGTTIELNLLNPVVSTTENNTSQNSMSETTNTTPDSISLSNEANGEQSSSRTYRMCNSKQENVDFDAIEVPVIILTILLVIYVCVCAVVFSAMEQWTYLESVYFCVMTFSTIGFGDYVPRYDPGIKHMFIAFYIVVGMVIMSACINLSQARINNFARMVFNWGCSTLSSSNDVNKD
ncbi:potassium channel subfamily K member 18-like [Saccoglossus kowalevskii]|uniref:Potassium channel subfamily K member 18-like n=1 Tax=Saccoglossus kowalevskii TaxID=10224 RepID=A0ABM0M6U0_SACKO|nr:PREDICTED: potassium channel subfamily K member 18-like [Saccoglossus kowalevskii]